MVHVPSTVQIPREIKSLDTAASDLIHKNHKLHDVFLNDRGFHNHMVHHILTAFTLGASEKDLESIYDSHAAMQRPLSTPTHEITHENFSDHLGDLSAYHDYLVFFRQEIAEHGMLNTIQYWTLHGDMDARIVGGLFHPLIHLSYAIDFDLVNIAAEGLAMAACTDDRLEKYITHSIDSADQAAETSPPDWLSQEALAQTLTGGLSDTPRAFRHNSLLALLQVFRQDKRLNDIVKQSEDPDGVRTALIFDSPVATNIIQEYIRAWIVQYDEHSVQEKVKDLYQAAFAIYAAGIKPSGNNFQFSVMHTLTGAYAIHVWSKHVSPEVTARLLRVHLARTLVAYLATGRPKTHYDLILNYRSLDSAGKGWSDAFARTLSEPEVHVSKVVKACAIGQQYYGQDDDNDDNSIWLRVSQATLDKHGYWTYASTGFD